MIDFHFFQLFSSWIYSAKARIQINKLAKIRRFELGLIKIQFGHLEHLVSLPAGFDR